MLQKDVSGSGVDPEAQKKRLAALVREYGAAKIEREPSNTVLVWPNLLVIEFLRTCLQIHFASAKRRDMSAIMVT